MGRDEDGGDALGVKRLLEILVGGGFVGSDQAQLRSGHPDQPGVLVVRALDPLEEDLVGEAGRVGQTLRRGASPRVRHAAVPSAIPAAAPGVTRAASAPSSCASRRPVASRSSAIEAAMPAASVIAAQTSGEMIAPPSSLYTPRQLTTGRAPSRS